MYEGVILLQYAIFEKTKSGCLPSYNNTGKMVKTIVSVSKEDCKQQIEKFLQENEFKKLTENNNGSISNKS